MGVFTIVGGGLYYDGSDLSPQVGSLSLEYAADVIDGTAIGDTNRVVVGGFKTATLGFDGFYTADVSSSGVDPVIFNRVGSTNTPITICPQKTSEGSRAFFLRALQTQFTPRGQAGGLFELGMQARGDDVLVSGTVLRRSTAENGQATGTAFDLGTSTSKRVYAAWHVFEDQSTGTIQVKLQSSPSSGFASPTTEITFSAVSGTTSAWADVAGSTRNWWRAVVVLTATSAGGTWGHIVSVGFSSSTQ